MNDPDVLFVVLDSEMNLDIQCIIACGCT